MYSYCKNCFDCELWARYRVNENAKPYVLAVLKAYGVGGDDIIEIDGDRLDPIYACTPPCKYLEVGVHRIKCIGRGTIESIIVIVYGEK